jgi:hypothetical protein
MKTGDRMHCLLLAFLLAYGLAMSVAKLDYNSVFVDEAYHIVMGRQLAAGADCPGCAAHTGSVMTWPLFASFGDAAGGLYGARAVNIALGLLLTLCVYFTARMLFGRDLGLIAAAIFLFSGQVLYLMKLATYDMSAAFFLGAAAMMFVAAGSVDGEAYRGAALAVGTVLLCLAAVTKYLLPAFIPFFLVWVIMRHGVARTVLFFLAPLCAFMLLFFWYSPYPPSPQVLFQIEQVQEVSRLPLRTLLDWTFRWLALACLLAAFGLFHERHRRTAALLIVLSTPVILIHLITRAEHSVNKNVVFSLIFLAPAAALGIDHIVHLFSMREANAALRRFFTSSILAIACVYGINNLRWLERQHPDVTPVIEFFERSGFDGMTVATNGWDGVLYEYALESRYPHARFDHVTWFIRQDGGRRRLDEGVDFVLCEDDYYGKHFMSERFRDVLDGDCSLVEEFTIRHSWGETHALVYGRKQR